MIETGMIVKQHRAMKDIFYAFRSLNYKTVNQSDA
jgi:hypothetical protein